MESSQAHIIRKQILEIEVPTSTSSRQLWEEEIRTYYFQSFLPSLEKEFDKLADSDQYLQIEKLELELNLSAVASEAISIEKVFDQALSVALKKIEPTLSKKQKAGSQRAIDCLTYFIAHGVLPWWAESMQKDVLSRAMKELAASHEEHVRSYLQKIQRSPIQLRRFIAHCPENFLLSLSIKLAGDNDNSTEFLAGLINSSLNLKFKESLIHILLNNYFPQVDSGVKIMLLDLEDIHGKEQLRKLLAAPSLQKWQNTEWEEESIDQLIKGLQTFDPAKIGYENIWIRLMGILARKDKNKWSKKIQDSLNHLPKQGYHSLRIWGILMQAYLLGKNPQKHEGNIRKLLKLIRKQGWDQIWNSLSLSNLTSDYKEEQELLDIVSLLATNDNSQAIKSWRNRFGDRGIEALLNQEKFRALGEEETNRPRETMDSFNETDGLFIQFGGIILLAPFLPNFFDRLGLLKENKFINEQKRQKAIYLLYYLASGEPTGAEFFFALMKLIVGSSLESPLSFETQLTEIELEEANLLLQAVLEHGQATFGKSSKEQLRNNFLMRKAKLSSQGNHWRLTLEKAAQDSLLAKLPWSFQIIKLPWMETHIIVEW